MGLLCPQWVDEIDIIADEMLREDDPDPSDPGALLALGNLGGGRSGGSAAGPDFNDADVV